MMMRSTHPIKTCGNTLTRLRLLIVGIVLLASLVLPGAGFWGRSKTSCVGDAVFDITKASAYVETASDTGYTSEKKKYPEIAAGTLTIDEGILTINYLGPEGQEVEIRYHLAPPHSDTSDSAYR